MDNATELPTLRLTTLRTLTRHAAPVAVVHLSTPLVELAPILEEIPGVWMVAVDDTGVVRGVLSSLDTVDALIADRDGWVSDHMRRATIALAAETEVPEASAAAEAHDAEHVLVVSGHGHVLGVVPTSVLATYRLAA